MQKTFILGILVSATILFSACTLPGKSVAPSTDQDQTQESPETSETAEIQVLDSFVFEATDSDTNALQATQARAEVGLKEYDFGSMVESINGQAATNSHYWALYVNDAYAEAAADQIELTAGDTVRWMYEEIQTGM